MNANSESNAYRPEDEVLIILDEADSTTDTTVRPMRESIRKAAEEYLGKLKEYRPEEYKRIMQKRK